MTLKSFINCNGYIPNSELFFIVFKLVESILTKKSGGERIINEYSRTKSLVDESRRKMVNILAADMTEKNGYFTNCFYLALVFSITLNMKSFFLFCFLKKKNKTLGI